MIWYLPGFKFCAGLSAMYFAAALMWFLTYPSEAFPLSLWWGFSPFLFLLPIYLFLFFIFRWVLRWTGRQFLRDGHRYYQPDYYDRIIR